MRFCVPVATLISLSQGITVQGSSVLTYRTVVLPTEAGFDLILWKEREPQENKGETEVPRSLCLNGEHVFTVLKEFCISFLCL